MRLVILLYLVFSPLAFASVLVAGLQAEISLLLAGLITLVWVLAFWAGRAAARKADSWSAWVWLFIVSNSVSPAASPHLAGLCVKGVVQVAGAVGVLRTINDGVAKRLFLRVAAR